MKDFLIVVDANIMKDYVESPLESYEDETHKEHVINAEKLFRNFKKNIKFGIDGDTTSSKILNQYKNMIGKKNEVLYKQYMIQLSQKRLRFISDNELNKVTSSERKVLVIQKGFHRKDLIYVSVAKSINNKGFIISRDHTFYEPTNNKKIGDCNTTIAKHLKDEFNIFVRISKYALLEKDIVINSIT